MLANTAVISTVACPATGIGGVPGGQAVTTG
jgi:hypothetical protein